MSKKLSSATLGAFVLGGLALALAVIMVLGGGRLFRDTFRVVVYFDQSVVGLKVGAPVKFRGIHIGEVHDIRINMKRAVFDPSNVRIPVILEFDEKLLSAEGVTDVDFDDPDEIRRLVEQGLRAELATESIVTGIRYVAIDVRPSTPIALVGGPDTDLPEIPSIRGPLEQIPDKVNQLLTNLAEIDVETLTKGFEGTIEDTRALLQSPDLKRALTGLDELVRNLNHTVAQLQRAADDISPVTAAVRETATSANRLFAPEGPLASQIEATLRELKAAARSMRRLADQVTRDPGSLVRGGRP